MKTWRIVTADDRAVNVQADDIVQSGFGGLNMLKDKNIIGAFAPGTWSFYDLVSDQESEGACETASAKSTWEASGYFHVHPIEVSMGSMKLSEGAYTHRHPADGRHRHGICVLGTSR